MAARLGRRQPNRPIIVRNPQAQEAEPPDTTPTTWTAGTPFGRWTAGAARGRWWSADPESRWTTGTPRGA